MVLENRFRDEHRGQNVGHEADDKRDSKASNRTGSEETEEGGGNNGRHVGINNCQESFVEAGIREQLRCQFRIFGNAVFLTKQEEARRTRLALQ